MSEFSIDGFISYCEKTREDQWCVDVVRTKDNKNCLFGHLFDFAGSDEKGNEYWDFFEYHFATTYMVYPVNDGSNDKYQQPTPKQRCIEYLKDLRNGKAKTTQDIMKDHDQAV